MYNIKIRLSLGFMVLITFLVYNAPGNAQGLESYQIDSIVKKSMEIMPQAGIAIAVVKNGKTLHAKGYGVASIENEEQVNENTLFAIASNSKSFTTAALAILVDEGKLSWQDMVVDHIPEFKMYNHYVTANFNIQDLLTHRSGLGLGAGDLLFWPGGTGFTIDDVINSFQYQKPISAFRTQYDYDNLMYMVAGEVVARVSGLSWSEFVQKRILTPLGMNDTVTSYLKLNDKSNLAAPHSSNKGTLKQLDQFADYNGLLGAAGGIYSSANDMSKWLLMHLNDCKYGENLSEQLISKQNHTEMWKPKTNISFNIKPSSRYKSHFKAYGLGWEISDQNGYIVIYHGGGLPGMLSRTVLIPELNVGIVVLTNSSPGGNSFYYITQSIIDSYIGVKKIDWIQVAQQQILRSEAQKDTAMSDIAKVLSNVKSNHLDFSNYVGMYRDNWFGNIEIGFKKGKLWFTSLQSPKMNGEMFYYKANTFVIKWDYTDLPCDAFASFNLNEKGKAEMIKLRGISPNIDFSFDFQDLTLNRVDDNNE